MKKHIRTFLILALISCMLTGCGSQDPVRPVDVACVVGITNNNPKVDVALIDEITGLAARPGSTYMVINAEGEPQVICSGEIQDLSDKGYTRKMMERIHTSITAGIRGKINAAVPVTPEVDIAAATVLAVRDLRACQAQGRDSILVFYLSGISTSGLIDMTQVPVYRMDTESSVQTVLDSLKLDLQGIDVVMYCCGDTAGEDQSALSFQEQQKLKEFYRSLFLGMGADSVSFREDLPGGESYSFDQPVSVMETEGTVSKLLSLVVDGQQIQLEEMDDIFADGEILSFPEQSIAFRPDSTQLADPAAARDALSHVIAYMQDHPDFELMICGTTTSAGGEDSSRSFSEERARAIRDLLVGEAGIDESRVHILGCGYSSLLYIPDRTSIGLLDESVAPLNRSVKLVDYRSDLALQILESLKAA